MKAFIFSLISLLTLCSGVVSAEPNQKVRAIETPAPEYPEAAKKEGHQGTVFITLHVLQTGNVESAEVKESSHSALLDEAALAAVRRWKLSPPTDSEGNPIATVVVAPVEFSKDTTQSVMEKTCADLTADAKFFHTAFPDKRMDEMRIAKLTLGMLVLSEQSIDKKLALGKAFPAVFGSVLSSCAAAPSESYGNTLRQALKAAVP